MNDQKNDRLERGRRRLLQALGALAGTTAADAVLPDRWTRPAIDSIALPLPAQSSPARSARFTDPG